jgi:2,3-di-O-geranylgeranylglyceryl phosphate reductase (EC 1.3.99.-)
MHEFFKPEDRWIAAEIEKANIIAPDGFKMELEPERQEQRLAMFCTARYLIETLSGWQPEQEPTSR